MVGASGVTTGQKLTVYCPPGAVLDPKASAAPVQSSYGGPARPAGITFDRFVRCCVVVRQLTESFNRSVPPCHQQHRTDTPLPGLIPNAVAGSRLTTTPLCRLCSRHPEEYWLFSCRLNCAKRLYLILNENWLPDPYQLQVPLRHSGLIKPQLHKDTFRLHNNTSYVRSSLARSIAE